MVAFCICCVYLVFMELINKLKVVSLLLGIFVLSGCITKSAYSIETDLDLASYDYVCLTRVSEDTRASDELESRLKDVFADAGLTVLTKDGLQEMPAERKASVLLAEYDREEGSLESIVSLYFSDYSNGEEVAYCRGTWGLKGEKNGMLAENNAVNQTRYLFGQGDELAEYNKYSWY